MEFIGVAGLSAAIHSALLVYGAWQDRNFKVKYTDVDYWVLSDAAGLMLGGKSPYERPTYRYSPILALLLLPNKVCGDWFGKALFSVFDLATGLIIYRLLLMQPRTSPRQASVYSALWLLNPVVLTVSTRGNAESFICFAVSLFVYLLARGRRSIAAMALGLSIHLKLFPVLYLPTVLVYMGLLSPGLSALSAQTPISSVMSTPSRPTSPASGPKPLGLRLKHVKVLLIAAMSFLVPTALTFYLYGRRAVEESLLYHLQRRDHRHNFSPYFLLFYLEPALGLPKHLAVLPFIPQAAIILLIAYKYGRRDFCFAVFLQTFLFVSLNKVITSQVLATPQSVLISLVLFVVSGPFAGSAAFVGARGECP